MAVTPEQPVTSAYTSQKAYMNWSGGKDSALCLYDVLQAGTYAIARLLTSVNAVHNRISMHGVRRVLLEAQSAALGIPLTTVELPEHPDMKLYENAMLQQVTTLKQSGCTHAVFGDIFLEDLRVYREQQLAPEGITGVFPLWLQDTRLLVNRFILTGFKSIIVCVNEQYLDHSFCGRIIDQEFLNDLPAGVDPCGENGEFHSFVFDGPIFRNPIRFNKGGIVYKTYTAPKHAGGQPQVGFYFCDLLPQ